MIMTAPEIVITWNDGEPVADNFLLRREIEINKDTLLVLHRCAAAVTREDLLKALREDGFDLDEAELAEAVAGLLEAGLLVDVAEGEDTGAIGRNPSWSTWGTEARYFHFATKDAPFAEAAAPETVPYFDELVTSPQPPLFKRYPQAPRLPLPRVRTEIPARFTDVLLSRRTVREFAGQPVTVEQLSRLCDLALAPQRFVNAEPFGALPLRAYANGGARSELEAYVNVIAVDGVDPGLYHYNCLEHSLELLGDPLSAQDMGYLSYEQPMCAAAAVSFFITARVDRVGHKYRHPRTLRTIYTDSGHLAQVFAMVATACGLGAWETLAFRDTEIERVLGIDGIAETVLYLLGAGVPAGGDEHTAVTLAQAARTSLYEDAAVGSGGARPVRMPGRAGD